MVHLDLTLDAGIDCAQLFKVPWVSLYSYCSLLWTNNLVFVLLVFVKIVRRIIAKAALSIFRDDIQASAGSF